MTTTRIYITHLFVYGLLYREESIQLHCPQGLQLGSRNSFIQCLLSVFHREAMKQKD